MLMVGIAQLVSAPDCGSGGQGFESLYPPYIVLMEKSLKRLFIFNTRPKRNIGLSPSGKAQDFDSCITVVQIHLAQFPDRYFRQKNVYLGNWACPEFHYDCNEKN